jgi:hypothetical protein
MRKVKPKAAKQGQGVLPWFMEVSTANVTVVSTLFKGMDILLLGIEGELKEQLERLVVQNGGTRSQNYI